MTHLSRVWPGFTFFILNDWFNFNFSLRGGWEKESSDPTIRFHASVAALECSLWLDRSFNVMDARRYLPPHEKRRRIELAKWKEIKANLYGTCGFNDWLICLPFNLFLLVSFPFGGSMAPQTNRRRGSGSPVVVQVCSSDSFAKDGHNIFLRCHSCCAYLHIAGWALLWNEFAYFSAKSLKETESRAQYASISPPLWGSVWMLRVNVSEPMLSSKFLHQTGYSGRAWIVLLQPAAKRW